MAEVGKREVRVDAFDKATGRTKYYEDLMPQIGRASCRERV